MHVWLLTEWQRFSCSHTYFSIFHPTTNCFTANISKWYIIKEIQRGKRRTFYCECECTNTNVTICSIARVAVWRLTMRAKEHEQEIRRISQRLLTSSGPASEFIMTSRQPASHPASQQCSTTGSAFRYVARKEWPQHNSNLVSTYSLLCFICSALHCYTILYNNTDTNGQSNGQTLEQTQASTGHTNNTTYI